MQGCRAHHEKGGEAEWLTVDECFRFLEGFDTDDPIGLRNYTITALLRSTGLRNSELCALDWRDIDPAEGALLVRKGKGGKQRQIFFNDRAGDDLIRYRDMTGAAPGDPVFSLVSKHSMETGEVATEPELEIDPGKQSIHVQNYFKAVVRPCHSL